MAFADDRKAYQRAWMRAKRRKDAAFAQRQSLSARAWQRRNPVRNAHNEYRKRSIAKGFAFDLTYSEFEALILADCGYCASSPDPVNGIDRKDNSKGYVRGNVIACCRRCNIAKGALSSEEFLGWIARVASHTGLLEK